MTSVEVSLRPDFHSDSCYTILGCGKSKSPEEIRKAYRDLSRKYHPDRYRADKETNHTFQRVYVAYSLICQSGEEEEDVKLDRDAMRKVRLEDAKVAFRQEFGDFRERYYARGAIVALPYPYQLKERLEKACLREALTLRMGCLQFSFFRSLLIKKELGIFFLISEVICVWGSVVLAVWNFLLQDFPEVIDEIPYLRDAGVTEIPHISIIGGLIVLIGSFVQHFWYGFTRHPIITDSEYGNWLWDGETSTSGELAEIYRICSQYYHWDSYKRSQVLTLLLCLPVLLVDHVPAILLSIPVYLTLSCQNYCGSGTTNNQSTHLAYQFAKSIGGLLVVVGSYLAWVLGGNYAKLAVAGVLYANQHLYTALLLRKSFFGFLQSILFQGVFAITIVRTSRQKQTPIKKQRSTETTDIEQGKTSERRDQPPPPKRNQVSPQKTIEEEVIDIVPVRSPSPQKTPASGMDMADPDDFGAKFDGFYTRPRSYPNSPSRSRDESIAVSADASSDGSNLVHDHRGRKYAKPVPGWYKKGEVITDTQQAAKEARSRQKKFDNINLFQCGVDTAIEDDDRLYGDPAASINGDKETATGFTSTKASTTFTSTTSKMEEKHSEEVEEPDLIALARSAKRRIEAEFFARIYGPSAGPGLQSPVSPDRLATSARHLPPKEQDPKPHRFEVPMTIEMKTPVKQRKPAPAESPKPMKAIIDAASENASEGGGGDGNKSIPSDESNTRMENLGFIPMYAGEQGNNRDTKRKADDNRPTSPDGDIENVLGPFIPLVKSATTRSNGYSVGASQATRMQSNREREAKAIADEEELQEEPIVLQHHPDKGLSGFRSVHDESRKELNHYLAEQPPRRSRTTGDIPDLIVGYDKASADESEITLDKRQFRKQAEAPPSFWEYWTNPTNSSLTRSLQ